MDSDAKKNRQEKVSELVKGLDGSIREFMNGDRYREFLNKMAYFHNYSLNNQLLIAMQKPDATLCASYTVWKRQGRYVKAGEKGIKILCPVPYKARPGRDRAEPETDDGMNPKGDEPEEMQRRTYLSFKVGNVFDYSQTGGEPLPTLSSELEGKLTDSDRMLFQAVKDVCPVPVSFQPLPEGLDGFYNLNTSTIVIRQDMSERQKLKTMVHEMTHSILHDRSVSGAPQDSATQEVQAESVAYVVCRYYGIDSSDFSFGYIAGWSQDKDTPQLKASLQVIRDTSCSIITKTEERIITMESGKRKAREAAGEVVPALAEDVIAAANPGKPAEREAHFGRHRGRCM